MRMKDNRRLGATSNSYRMKTSLTSLGAGLGGRSNDNVRPVDDSFLTSIHSQRAPVQLWTQVVAAIDASFEEMSRSS